MLLVFVTCSWVLRARGRLDLTDKSPLCISGGGGATAGSRARALGRPEGAGAPPPRAYQHRPASGQRDHRPHGRGERGTGGGGGVAAPVRGRRGLLRRRRGYGAHGGGGRRARGGGGGADGGGRDAGPGRDGRVHRAQGDRERVGRGSDVRTREFARRNEGEDASRSLSDAHVGRVHEPAFACRVCDGSDGGAARAGGGGADAAGGGRGGGRRRRLARGYGADGGGAMRPHRGVALTIPIVYLRRH
eukprot:1188031-Prorocentrum_minimum.AAC.1